MSEVFVAKANSSFLISCLAPDLSTKFWKKDFFSTHSNGEVVMESKTPCSQFSKIKTLRRGLFVLTIALFAFFLGGIRPSDAGVDVRQCANKDSTAGDCHWINSIVHQGT